MNIIRSLEIDGRFIEINNISDVHEASERTHNLSACGFTAAQKFVEFIVEKGVPGIVYHIKDVAIILHQLLDSSNGTIVWITSEQKIAQITENHVDCDNTIEIRFLGHPYPVRINCNDIKILSPSSGKKLMESYIWMENLIFNTDENDL